MNVPTYIKLEVSCTIDGRAKTGAYGVEASWLASGAEMTADMGDCKVTEGTEGTPAKTASPKGPPCN